ncbi:MAG: hypothetical protein ACRCV6_00325 [Formosimonas sp.]
MNAQYWRVIARSPVHSSLFNWRERLVELVGHKPRRISALAESVLYGALDCLAQVPDFNVHDLSVIRLTTVRGPYTASKKVLRSSEHELPMPFTFLQSQTSQALVALVAQLKWQGDASIGMAAQPLDFVRMAMVQARHGAVLLGCAEEIHENLAALDNHWLCLQPCEAPEDLIFSPIIDWQSPVDYWQLNGNELRGATYE